ncbi:MAG: hypothetical protein J7513_11365 [Solirubrobacteraceae bacterium]|nr:hypothetical protein [Solirubrobacteraceae bacterium]
MPSRGPHAAAAPAPSTPRARAVTAVPALALAGLALTLAACGGDDDQRTTPPSAGPRAATVAVDALPGTLDPAQARTVAERAIAVATQIPLLTYRHTAGDDAATLQPALAGDLPSLSADEREYRFQLRSGLVYADGGLVKASDVERAIAHASVDAADEEVRDALASIEGAPSKDGQTISGVRSDDRTGVIEVELRRPDGRVPLALADPATAPQPAIVKDDRAPASTGPLRIASRTARSIQLAANPLRPTISTVPAARLAQISLVPRPRSEGGVTAKELRAGDVDLDLGTPTDGERGDRIAQLTGPSSSIVAAFVAQRGSLASRALRRTLAEAVDTRGLSDGTGVAAACGLLPSFAVGAVDREPCPPAPVVPDRRPLTGATIVVAVPDDAWSAAVLGVVRRAIASLGGDTTEATAADPIAALTDGSADIGIARTTPRLPHPSLWLAPAAAFDPLLERELPRLTRGPLTGSGSRWSALDRRAIDRGVAIPLLALQRVVTTGPDLDRRSVLIHPVLGIDLAALDLS